MKKLILSVVFFAMSLQVGGGALYAAAEQKEQVGDTSSYFDQFVQAVGNRAKATKKELSFLWGYLLKKYIHGEKTTQKEDERAKRIQKKIGIAIGALVAIVATVVGFTWYKNRAAGAAQRAGQKMEDPIKQAEAIKKVDELVKKNEINVKDSQGNTPLYNAVQEEDYILVRLLLEKGAKIEASGFYGYTPLHIAAKNGNLEVVRLLLEKGAKIDATDESSDTPLHDAVKHGSFDVVRLLLEKGADKTMKNKRGQTPLNVAEEMRDFLRYILTVEEEQNSNKIIEILSSPSNKKIRGY